LTFPEQWEYFWQLGLEGSHIVWLWWKVEIEDLMSLL